MNRIALLLSVTAALLASACRTDKIARVDDDRPDAPRGLRVVVEGVDRASLSWSDASIDEDGFFIYRKGPTDTTFEFHDVVERGVTTYCDSTLYPESKYHYRVRAVNVFGLSGYSNEVTISTPSNTVFAEGFENYRIGETPPSPWNDYRQVGSSWARVTDTRPHSGSKSFQFHDPDTGYNYATMSIGGFDARDATLTMWLFLPPNSHFGLIGVDRTDSIVTFRTQFNNDRSIIVQGGAYLRLLQGACYPTGQWFKLDVDICSTAGYYTVSINDTLLCDWLALVRPDYPTVRLYLLAFSDTEMSDGFVDDISCVRTLAPSGAPQRDSFRSADRSSEGPMTIEGVISSMRSWSPHQ